MPNQTNQTIVEGTWARAHNIAEDLEAVIEQVRHEGLQGTALIGTLGTILDSALTLETLARNATAR